MVLEKKYHEDCYKIRSSYLPYFVWTFPLLAFVSLQTTIDINASHQLSMHLGCSAVAVTAAGCRNRRQSRFINHHTASGSEPTQSLLRGGCRLIRTVVSV